MTKYALSPLLVSLTAIAVGAPLHAQNSDTQPVAADESEAFGAYDGDDEENYGAPIVVVGQRSQGSVDTDIAAVDTLDADDIASYGAGSVEELLDALAPQIGSGRGRGGGRPVMLINGRPVNNFREVFGLPPEAIRTVEVFPEELALKYGYRPDQRVVNLILVPGYASGEIEVEVGAPTDGGRWHQEYEAGLTTIGEKSRFNAELEYSHDGAITYAERDLPGNSAADAAVRSLSPRSQTMEAKANWSLQVAERSDLSLSAGYTVEDSNRNQGLQSLSLDDGGTQIDRLVPGTGGLLRDSSTETIEGSAGLNGMVGDWRWRVSSNLSKVNSDTRTQRGIDEDAVQAAVDGSSFDAGTGDLSLFAYQPSNFATSDTITTTGLANASGPLFALPAGDAQLSVTATGGYNRIRSEATIDDVATSSRLSRRSYGAEASLDLPIADDSTGLGQALGKFSINLNGGYEDLSDFGSLLSYGAGLNWDAADNLDVNISFIGEEAAPSLSDLGAPVIVTPNTEIYDYTQGETAFVDFITGGNPDLAKEKRRDIKVTATWETPFVENLRVTGEYLRNRSYDVTSGFPALTPSIESAFPDRVTRDGDGDLLSIDARPVTYAETRNDLLKLTLAYSAEIGGGEEKPRGEGRGGPRGGDNARGGGFPIPGMGRDRRGGRLRVSLGYQYQLKDEILIAPGLPTLDLLNGDATGSNGGTPRHKVELESNLFMNGWGVRLSGNYESGTTVDGSELTGSSDLDFGSLTTFDARVFLNLDEFGPTKDVGLFDNSRISLRVDNIFDSYREVRDEDGDIPFRYNRAFVEPVGRYVELDFRKRF